MFGHAKQSTTHLAPLAQQAGEEPVHTFDQTNGVLRQFDERNAAGPQDTQLRHELAGPMAAASFTRIGR